MFKSETQGVEVVWKQRKLAMVMSLSITVVCACNAMVLQLGAKTQTPSCAIGLKCIEVVTVHHLSRWHVHVKRALTCLTRCRGTVLTCHGGLGRGCATLKTAVMEMVSFSQCHVHHHGMSWVQSGLPF